MAASTGIIVLGMHRSGTSALARVLNLAGCALPASLMPARAGNAAGHWESEAVCAFNQRLLASLGSDWADWRALAVSDEAQVAQAAALVQAEFAGQAGNLAPMFVLKDPRCCRLARFWRAAVQQAGAGVACVLPLRNPLDVAASLRARDGLAPDLGLLLWLRHVLDAEAQTRGGRRVFTRYEALLRDWPGEMARIGATLGLGWPGLAAGAGHDVEAFLAQDLRHHAASDAALVANPALSPWLVQVWQVLGRWAAQGEQAGDWASDCAVLDGVAAALNAAEPAFAGLLAQGAAQGRAADELARAHEAAEAQRAELAGRLGALGDRHEAALQTCAEMESANAELGRLNAELHQANTGLRHAQAELESRLLQRQAEIEEAWDEAAAARSAAEAAQQALAQHERQLAQAQAWVFRLAGERQAGEQALAAQARKLAQAQAAQAQAQTAQAQAQREAAAAKAQATTAQAQATTAHAQANQLRSHLLAAQASAQGLALGFVLAREQAETHASALAEAQLTAQHQAEQHAQQHAAQQAEREEVEARLAESFGELASLTTMLRDASTQAQTAQTRADKAQAAADWLRRLHAALRSRPQWWAFMPLGWQAVQDGKLLRARAVFNPEGYLQRYPDVAGAGMEPLRHFILHGLGEGRSACV